MFTEAEKDFDLVFSALKTGRSLAASYNLQTDIQCKLNTHPAASPLLIDNGFI